MAPSEEDDLETRLRRILEFAKDLTPLKRSAMQIYVAGSSKELDRCEQFVRAVRALGHTITCDWVAAMRANAADTLLSPEELRRFAAADLRGVADADLVVLLGPAQSTPSQGCWVEMGYALAMSVPLIYVAPQSAPQFCIFTSMIAVQFASDSAALAHLEAA
jgi:nucleoside 2-deoxyribosyltransferase